MDKEIRLKKHNLIQLHLPLWKRVIFVDWNGVLSNDVFWSSIRKNPIHPYYERLTEACKRLFEDNYEIIRSWMRGEVSSHEIINYIDIDFDRRYKENFLIRRLHKDCRRMNCEDSLLEELQKCRNGSFVVLATDNMDCFHKEISSIRDLAGSFDGILCSSDIGLLKSDNVFGFFYPWLRAHNLNFSKSILIDDSEKTCFKFKEAGGSAILVKSLEDTIIELWNWLKNDV